MSEDLICGHASVQRRSQAGEGRGGEGRGEEGRAGAHGHDGQSKAPTLKGEEMREREISF